MTGAATSGRLGPLRHRPFRRLWLGQSLSSVGDAVIPVALPLIVITETGSATQLGLILAASLTAQLAVFLPAGVWADRLPRRVVMLTADLVRCLVQLAVGIDLLGGNFDVVHLAVAAALTGAANAFFLPSIRGLVPATVPAADLRQANALMGVSKRTAFVLAPAIATALVLSAGGGWALVLDAATFAASAAALATLRVTGSYRARSGFLTELHEGWLHVWQRRWYWTNLVAHAAWNLGRCVYVVVGPLIAIQSLGGSVAWGVIVQGSTIGALIGSLVALKVRPRRPLLVANLWLALGALPLLGLGAGAHPIVIAILAGMMSMGLGLASAMWETVVQQQIPERLLSRVTSYDWLVSVLLNPLGTALAGPVASWVGPQWTVVGTAVLVAGACLGVLAVPDVARLRRDTPQPQAQAEKEVDHV